MAHLAAMSNAALADGLRLAGIPTAVAAPGEPARAALRALLRDDELGLLLVTDDLWASLDERSRRTLEYLPRPLVLAIPAGEISEAGARRELLGEMLERAIGYRIELGGMER
jgi:vacuolar-type H+-ATPase subunit F/Vma7